jgi:hypothetical protein
MIGKNALWVAKQHGHSIATMLRAYAAWAEGSVESDIKTIRRSMSLTPAPRGLPARADEVCSGRWQDYSARTGLTPSGPRSGR